MRLSFVLILLVGASVLAPLAGASHPPGATLGFALTPDSAPPAVGFNLGLMNRVGGGHAIGGSTFAFDEIAIHCKTWVSDEPAPVATTIPAQSVDWTLEFQAPSAISRVTVQIGKWSGAFEGSGPESAATVPLPGGTVPAVTQLYSGTAAYGGQTIPADDRMAVRVCVSTVGDHTKVMLTGGGESTVSFANSGDPPFPTPELGTIALTATGMLGVLGLGLVRRRKL